MSLLLVLWVVSAHFVADFVSQSHWMGSTKGQWRFTSLRSWWPLTAHVLTYTLVLLGVMGTLLLVQPISPAAVRYWVLVNGGVHFLVDAATCKLTKALWFIDLAPRVVSDTQVSATVYPFYARIKSEDPNFPHWFFTAIGFDQWVHYVCLFVTAAWWLR